MAARTGERLQLDGHTDVVRLEDLQPGVILRMGNVHPNESGGEWVASPFSDNVILKVAAPDAHGDAWVTLARPYGYAYLTGTTGPGLLTGQEEYKVTAKNLIGGKSLFRVVLNSRREPYKMCLDREPA